MQLAGHDGDDARAAPAARDASIEMMRACANGLRSSSRWSMPGSIDVVDVVALAADEARVLLALDGVADAADLWSVGRHH